METESVYFQRKWRELALIERNLSQPASCVVRPRTIGGLIKAKFSLAAELKAQHALRSWQNTETCWQSAVPLRAGLFKFDYRYQRADLAVSEGPLPYGSPDRFPGAEIQQITYTCSGMAAISAILLAVYRPGAKLLYKPGCYKETLELASSWVTGLQVVDLSRTGHRSDVLQGEQLLWLDVPPGSKPSSDQQDGFDRIDLIVFDTTCFNHCSGRIRRIVMWARRAKVPIILVRSHTKLDSLGIEYGRLGSAMFLSFPEVPCARAARLREIAHNMQELVRLLGSAALPAHFCPFVGGSEYRQLSVRRSAARLRNGRLLARMLVQQLGASAVRVYPHGLFTALVPPHRWSEDEVASAAEELATDLSRRGFPVFHAGSFGFDFTAVEAFFDTEIDRPVMRVAIGDLPLTICAQVANAIAGWWARRCRLRAA